MSLLAAAAVLMILFVIREHRAIDPILPLDLMMRPVIAASLVGSLLFGAILFGLDAYVPLYMQGVRGGSATAAGLALMPLFCAWAISVALAAKAVIHHGFRRAGMIGSAIVAVGSLLLVIEALDFLDWANALVFIRRHQWPSVEQGWDRLQAGFILAVPELGKLGATRGVTSRIAATFLRNDRRRLSRRYAERPTSPGSFALRPNANWRRNRNRHRRRASP